MDRRPVELAFHDQRVDLPPNVVDDDVAHDADLVGLGIDFHDRDMRGVCEVHLCSHAPRCIWKVGHWMGEILDRLDARLEVRAPVREAEVRRANDLGNLVSRTLTMVANYCGGRVPERHQPIGDEPQGDAIFECYERLDFPGALAEVWKLIGAANRGIVEAAPWELAKDPARRQELEKLLYTCLERVRAAAVLVSPVMPGAARRIFRMLGLPDRDPEASETDGALIALLCLEAEQPPEPVPGLRVLKRLSPVTLDHLEEWWMGFQDHLAPATQDDFKSLFVPNAAGAAYLPMVEWVRDAEHKMRQHGLLK